jgi:flagellar basal-body rod protein FlgB
MEFDQTIQAIGSYMSRLSQRVQVVASNLSNIDTPGYKTKDVSFHATMQELLAENSLELRKSDPEHMGGWTAIPIQAQPFEEQGLISDINQNNVDLDREMLKLSETSFGYSLISQILKDKFRTLAISINEGKANDSDDRNRSQRFRPDGSTQAAGSACQQHG